MPLLPTKCPRILNNKVSKSNWTFNSNLISCYLGLPRFCNNIRITSTYFTAFSKWRGFYIRLKIHLYSGVKVPSNIIPLKSSEYGSCLVRTCLPLKALMGQQQCVETVIALCSHPCSLKHLTKCGIMGLNTRS